MRVTGIESFFFFQWKLWQLGGEKCSEIFS
jgi:hypothetical protein